MSYCRFSSENFACDLYCYATAEGYVTNVATHRLKEAPPRGIKARAEYFANAAEWAPIGLAHDGEHYLDSSLGEMIARIQSLAELGYHVPVGLVESLQDEAKGQGVEQ